MPHTPAVGRDRAVRGNIFFLAFTLHGFDHASRPRTSPQEGMPPSDVLQKINVTSVQDSREDANSSFFATVAWTT